MSVGARDNPLGLCDWCDFGHCDPPDGTPCTDDDCTCECRGREGGHPMTTPEPQLSDFPSLAAYRAARAAASPEDRARWSAETDAKLFAAIEAAGGRTADCEHGYHWHDSCPVCD